MVARAPDKRLHLWDSLPPGPKRRFGWIQKVRLTDAQALYVSTYADLHDVSVPEIMRCALDKMMKETDGQVPDRS